MVYYSVKPQYDQLPRYRINRDGQMEWDSIFIANELYTEKELTKLYSTHVIGFSRDKLFSKIECPKSKTYWCFGARFLAS